MGEQSGQQSVSGQSTLSQLLTTAGDQQEAIGSLNVRIAAVSASAASLPLTSAPAGKRKASKVKEQDKGVGCAYLLMACLHRMLTLAPLLLLRHVEYPGTGVWL